MDSCTVSVCLASTSGIAASSAGPGATRVTLQVIRHGERNTDQPSTLPPAGALGPCAVLDHAGSSTAVVVGGQESSRTSWSMVADETCTLVMSGKAAAATFAVALVSDGNVLPSPIQPLQGWEALPAGAVPCSFKVCGHLGSALPFMSRSAVMYIRRSCRMYSRDVSCS